ncbi:PAS domain S-box protein [Phenylobacterium sp.]|uniref:sensor histidine kinase n=1 Tax=Phenylobacterium sp. TaxID=1871053 RepID=UPI0028A0398C|nr:PAS domain S-box protein [Phenylobacterium sp.]
MSAGVLTALSQAPLGIAIFDREMRYLAASSRYLTEQGLPGDLPLVGRRHYDVFPDIPQRWREIHTRALMEGAELSHDADPFERADGHVDWIRWSLKPWRTDDGEIGGLVLYTEFVTPSVEARARLEAAEARYRAVFDQAAMGVARVMPDGRFLEVNDRFCAMLRYSRDELKDMTFQQITHPDDLNSNIALTAALLAGSIETYSMEKRYLTKDGEVVWNNLTVALVRTSAGEPDYFISIIDDIGARKQAEAEQKRYQDQLRLMINELNHRVKNTLATVQSMASQTLRGESDPRVVYEKLEARLMGLSQAHDVLTRERWHGAELQDVADRALGPFLGSTPGQIVLQGPSAWLQPGAALSMALIFHELATNAVKYGALSVEGGRVDLTWTLDGADLALTWAEHGGPPVSPPTRKGFGTRLIERGLRGDLRGTARMSYEPGGLVCTMRARLAGRSDPPSLFEGA